MTTRPKPASKPPTQRGPSLVERALRHLPERWRPQGLVELLPFTLLALGAGALSLFIALADEVLEGDTAAFDETLLLALRNPADPADPIGPRWLETMMLDITSLGSVTVLTIVCVSVVIYLLIDGKRATALFVLAAIAGGAILSSLTKLAFARPRPELVAHLVDVSTYSFPSGHAMSSAVTYLTLGALLARTEAQKRIKTYLIGLALTLTLMIGISRVYLGVHWPSDVLAGWSLGATWAILCWLLNGLLQRRGRVEQED